MHLIPIIDYSKIGAAQEYYTGRGYSEIAVPWLLEYEAYCATRPPDRREFFSLHGYLNASGEQGFLELMLSGRRLSKHSCVTTCFRDEPDLDTTHHRYFVKLELIDTDVSRENLESMISDALQFTSRYVPVKLIPTNLDGTAFDIVDAEHGIELGSYGIRTYGTHSWIFGTGIALPRLDTVISLIKR